MIYLYNNATVAFLKRARVEAWGILRDELGLTVLKERFEFAGRRVPLTLTVFEGGKSWGLCWPEMYQIGLNKALMWQAKSEVLRDVLRHELAHLFTHLIYPGAKASGNEFRQVCAELFKRPDIAPSQMHLQVENERLEGELDWERMHAKLKKLLSLATSTNQHEAQLAAAKANRLILDYNLGKMLGDPDELPDTFAKRVLQGKRVTGTHRAIAEILRSFLVTTVFNYGRGWFYLEAIGERANVEFADYVAGFLERELESLWCKALQEDRVDGGPRPHKASFMAGVAQGYTFKIQQSQEEALNATARAAGDLRLPARGTMALIKRRLEGHLARVHSSLRYSSSSASDDGHWRSQGQQAGMNLNIHRPLSSSGQTLLLGE